ncbi:MAG: NAD(P)-dependent alcohol dehydrogenase [Acidimicrobiia bacterium]
MKAIVQHEYGTADVLQFDDIATPEVAANEVLVEVEAAGTHIGDWLVMNGLPYLIRAMGYGVGGPKNTVLGTEVAGRVASTGEGAQKFQPGDEVFGWCTGSFAEFVSVPEDALALKPADASFEQAGALPISGLTALQAVRDKGRVKPGQNVMVIGASGAVGSFAVQIAKVFGAEVTGVASTRNAEMVTKLGADRFVDYTTEDITETGRQYDVVIDTAGNRPLSDLRKALTRDGTLVIVGGSGGRWLMGSGRSLRATLSSPFVSQTLRPFIAAPNQEDLLVLKELVESGEVTTVIDRTFPLDQAPDAMRYLGARHTQGKTVITV